MTRPRASKLPDLARASWIHRCGGVDYGPFRSPEILDLIESGRVREDDSFLDRMAGRLWSLQEIPDFVEAWEKRQRALAEQAMEQETARSVSHIQQRRRARPLVFGLVISASLVGGWYVYQEILPSHGRVVASAIGASAVPGPGTSFAAIEWMRRDRARAAARARAEREKAARGKAGKPNRADTPRHLRARHGGHGQRAAGGTAEAEQRAAAPQEFDFSEEEVVVDARAEPPASNGPRPLREKDLRGYLATLRPTIMRCVRLNADGFPPGGYRVGFLLQPTGELTSPSLLPRTEGSAPLMACLNHVARTHRFRAFVGVARALHQSFRVDDGPQEGGR